MQIARAMLEGGGIAANPVLEQVLAQDILQEPNGYLHF